MARTNRKTWLAAAALLGVVGVAPGCAATAMRAGPTRGDPVPYAGTFLDIYGCTTSLAPLAILDLPLSFAADTLLLPIDGIVAFAEWAASGARGAGMSAGGPAPAPSDHRECPKLGAATPGN